MVAPERAALREARRALDLVGSDPPSAVRCAHAALVLGRRERDPEARSAAQRALGLAHRELGDLPAALSCLRSAVRTAAAARLDGPAAEARMSLAFALLDRGRLAAALREADRAAGALSGVPAARLLAQRALVLQRSGRLDEALAAFRTALPVLQRGRDTLWEARLRNNRGLLLAYRGDLAGAERDLVRAEALHASLGHDLHAADATWNLGFVAARRGDVPAALACYDRTAERYAAGGVPVPELLVDRAEVLLAAGLVDEARQCADDAAAVLGGMLRETDLAEAELLQAQCALAAHDAEQAADLAARAQERFRRQGRAGWALVAGYVGLRAAADRGAVVRTAGAARTADALHDAGWRALALDVRLLVAEAALAAGDRATAEQQLRRATAARGGTVELRVRAWYAEALLRQAHGQHSRVESALRAGLRAVEEYRTSLGATELRVHASSHAAALARVGLAAGLRHSDATRVLAWSERYRAGVVRLRPVAPPTDGELAGLLADLRRVSSELETALLEGRPTGVLRSRQVAVERAVRDCSRLAAGPSSGPDGRRRTEREPTGRGLSLVPLADLRAALGDRALVSYLTLDGTLHAVSLTRRGIGLHPLGAAAQPERALAAVHFALRRLAGARGSPAALLAAREAAEHAAAVLEERLVTPLLAAIGDRSLVVVPTAALHAVPWGLLPALRGRPLVVAPSASVWYRAAALPAVGVRGHGLLVAGPDLPEAAREVAALRAAHPEAACLTGSAATAGAVLDSLGRVEWAHLAAHGTLRTDNPLFSAVELAHGPLTVYDLEGLPRVPGLVALPLCQSGVGTVHAGEEVLGLAAALLALGTRTLVATVIPVPDETSRELMLGLHARLAATDDVPVALAAAQAAMPRDDPAGLAAVAGFVVLGA